MVWWSLWTTLWAMVLVTLPFHLVLHGIALNRVARRVGWRRVLRRGRYLQEIRADAMLTRLMLIWLVVSLVELCLLMGVAVFAFTSAG